MPVSSGALIRFAETFRDAPGIVDRSRSSEVIDAFRAGERAVRVARGVSDTWQNSRRARIFDP